MGSLMCSCTVCCCPCTCLLYIPHSIFGLSLHLYARTHSPVIEFPRSMDQPSQIGDTCSPQVAQSKDGLLESADSASTTTDDKVESKEAAAASPENDTSELEEKLAKVSLEEKKNEKKAKTSKKEKKESKGNSQKKSSKSGQLLTAATIEGVAEYINSGKCKNVIFMVGAGISTSAGIPDFRSPDTGLFSQLEKYNLPYPEAVFDIGFFNNNPKPFFHLARELFPGNFEPTPCHHFMRLFHDKDLLLRLYTQNIDSLERLAGVPGDKLIESHGTFHTSHCVNKRCRKEYSLEWMKGIVLDKEREDNIARCVDCNSYVKPDIIFYGEMLPDRFYTLIETDFRQCDLLIIMGTSLTVQPFASLVDFVGSNVPRLMINLTKPEGGGNFLSKFIPGIGSGMDFDSKSNVRNVFMKCDTDSGCKTFAELLNWTDELDLLINGTAKSK